MELSPNDVHSRLQQLAKKDRKRKVFGASAHDYQLNPPLDAEVVASFEAEHGITLPEHYRRFITEIGNGGAGPFYGLFAFGHYDEGPWKVGVLVGDVGQPFPHTEAWNLGDEFWAKEPEYPDGISEEDEERLNEEWDNLLEAEYWSPKVVNGAIPICHIGCLLRQWLVVHGEQRGYVWTDYRVDCAGLFPLKDTAGKQMRFADWYLGWLEKPSMRAPYDDGQSFVYQRFIISASGTVTFAKALNRSVTGSMNDLVHHAEMWLADGEISPQEVGFKLNDIMLSALATEESPGYGKPNEAFKAMLGSQPATVQLSPSARSSTQPTLIAMGNKNRKAKSGEMAHVRRVIKEAFPNFEPVFGGHGAYGGHRAPRDHTISFRLRDHRGKFHSNVVWLMPDELSSLTAEDIKWLVAESNGKRKRKG